MIFEEKYIMSTLENSTLLIPDPQTETESIFDDILTGLNAEELQNWEDLEEQIDITDLVFSRKEKTGIYGRGEKYLDTVENTQKIQFVFKAGNNHGEYGAKRQKRKFSQTTRKEEKYKGDNNNTLGSLTLKNMTTSLHFMKKHPLEVNGKVEPVGKLAVKNQVIERRNQTYPCENCSDVFRKKEQLLKHNAFVHEGNKPAFKCHLCDSRFTFKSLLAKHKKDVHDVKFKCTICGKSFGSKRHFHKHDLKAHLTEK